MEREQGGTLKLDLAGNLIKITCDKHGSLICVMISIYRNQIDESKVGHIASLPSSSAQSCTRRSKLECGLTS